MVLSFYCKNNIHILFSSTSQFFLLRLKLFQHLCVASLYVKFATANIGCTGIGICDLITPALPSVWQCYLYSTPTRVKSTFADLHSLVVLYKVMENWAELYKRIQLAEHCVYFAHSYLYNFDCSHSLDCFSILSSFVIQNKFI